MFQGFTSRESTPVSNFPKIQKRYYPHLTFAAWLSCSLEGFRPLLIKNILKNALKADPKKHDLKKGNCHLLNHRAFKLKLWGYKKSRNGFSSVKTMYSNFKYICSQ